jgi:hypothetical protein
MRCLTRWTCGAALAALALTACPPPDVEPARDAGPEDAGHVITPVELCERISVARCDLMSRCFAAFTRDTRAQCQNLEQTRCNEQYSALRPSFESKRVEIDEAKVVSCEDRMKTSACTPTFPPNYVAAIAKPFSDCTLTTGLLRGKIKAGETCDELVECAPGTRCVKPGGVCTGTCSTLPSAGEPCGVGCATGTFCDGKGTPNAVDDRCEPLKAQNEICETSAECQQDLWCDGSCRVRGAVGDNCIFDPLRLSTCAPGLACDVVPWVSVDDEPLQGTCILPRPQLGACWFHWSCQPGLVCYDLDLADFPDFPPANPGSCQSPAPFGETCLFTPFAVFMGDPCAAGLACGQDFKCNVRPVLGEGCDPQTQGCVGFGNYCKPSATSLTQGTCTGAPGLDERCATRLTDGRIVSIPCDTGYCDSEGQGATLKCRPAFKAISQTCTSNGECLSDRCAVQEDRSLRCATSCD